jgi:N-acetylglucosamine-6-sulfatase
MVGADRRNRLRRSSAFLTSTSSRRVQYAARELRFRYEKDVIMGVGVSPAERRRRQRRTAQTAGIAAMLVAFIAFAALATPVAPAASGVAPTRPNIVFILTDDLSWNLITPRIAPHIIQLERRGETFTNYYVADSLCCPSRATIFTGLFPHDTKVTTNVPPYGGYTKFVSQGLSKKTFAVALQKEGYKTSLLGKYLNGNGDKGGAYSSRPGGATT